MAVRLGVKLATNTSSPQKPRHGWVTIQDKFTVHTLTPCHHQSGSVIWYWQKLQCKKAHNALPCKCGLSA